MVNGLSVFEWKNKKFETSQLKKDNREGGRGERVLKQSTSKKKLDKSITGVQLAESNPKTIVLKAMFLHMSRRRTLRTPGCDLSRRPSTTLVRKKLAGKYRSYEGCSSRRKHKR